MNINKADLPMLAIKHKTKLSCKYVISDIKEIVKYFTKTTLK